MNDAEPATDQPTDRDLIAMLRRGEMDALAQLYLRHGAPVYRTALRLSRSQSDAEDVLQDVFVGLRSALRHFDDNRPLGPWLNRITVHHALMRSRTERRERAREARWAADRDPVARLGWDPGDEARRMEVVSALGRLPAGQREVFILREIEGYAHREIADLLRISVRASTARLHRAWKALTESSDSKDDT